MRAALATPGERPDLPKVNPITNRPLPNSAPPAVPVEVRKVLGSALAASQTDTATDALIKTYQATPPGKLYGILLQMSTCSTARMANFLADEFDRLPEGQDRRDVMVALQDLLARPLR